MREPNHDVYGRNLVTSVMGEAGEGQAATQQNAGRQKFFSLRGEKWSSNCVLYAQNLRGMVINLVEMDNVRGWGYTCGSGLLLSRSTDEFLTPIRSPCAFAHALMLGP